MHIYCKYKHSKTVKGLFLPDHTLFVPPDAQFEEDVRVMPLMSATKIWSTLEDTVADKSLFNTINILLVVQVILQIIYYYVHRIRECPDMPLDMFCCD